MFSYAPSIRDTAEADVDRLMAILPALWPSTSVTEELVP